MQVCRCHFFHTQFRICYPYSVKYDAQTNHKCLQTCHNCNNCVKICQCTEPEASDLFQESYGFSKNRCMRHYSYFTGGVIFVGVNNDVMCPSVQIRKWQLNHFCIVYLRHFIQSWIILSSRLYVIVKTRYSDKHCLIKPALWSLRWKCDCATDFNDDHVMNLGLVPLLFSLV